ncbi:MAG: glutathione S-transferase [Oricola sp.]
MRIFLAEKGISLPLVPVDMERLGHRSEEIRSRNPLQRLPVLELDDGRVLSETIAICRYFEALCPQPALFGTEPFEQAEIEMWQRRVEFHFLYAVAQAFRHLHPAMAGWEEPQIAEWGEANKPKALEFMRLLDGELATRAHVAGGRFSVADITATVAADFCKPARIAIPAELEHFHRWYAAMRERPSYTA